MFISPFRIAAFTLAALIMPTTPSAYGFSIGSDSFDGATNIFYSYSDNISNPTNVFSYSTQGSEPLAQSAGKTAWWKWTAPTNGWCTVDTLESQVDNTTVAVYTGATLSSLSRVAFNDNHQGSAFSSTAWRSSTSFYVRSGQLYYIQLGSYLASVNPSNVTLRVRLLEHKSVTRRASWKVIGNGSYETHLGGLIATMTAKGSVSGKLVMQGKTYAFKGTVGSDGFMIISIPRKATSQSPMPLPINLRMDFTGRGAYDIQFNSEGHAAGNFYPEKNFTSSNPNSMAGYYTSRMKLRDYSGYGYYTTTLSKTGNVTGTFTTTDGVISTFGTRATSDRLSASTHLYYAFFKSLHSGKGGLISEHLVFNNIEYAVLQSDGDSNHYHRPARLNSDFHTGGYSGSAFAEGGLYQRPTASSGRVMGFLNPTGTGILTLPISGTEIPSAVTQSLNLRVNNKFVFGEGSLGKPTLSLKTKTGVVTGSLIVHGRKRNLRGIICNMEGTKSLVGHASGLNYNTEFRVTAP